MELSVRSTEKFTLILIHDEFVKGHKILDNQSYEDVFIQRGARPELEDAPALPEAEFDELMAVVFQSVRQHTLKGPTVSSSP